MSIHRIPHASCTANGCRGPARGRRTWARNAALPLLAFLLVSVASFAAEIAVPQNAQAGAAFTISTTGSGDAMFYLIGPAARLKRKVSLGHPVTLNAGEVRLAGRYLAILKTAGGTVAQSFFVRPADIENVNFLAQPSRVPTGVSQVISGTAFVMDRFHNLVLTPTPVKFELAVEGAAPEIRTVTSRDGVAWTRMDSTRRAGSAQFTATAGDGAIRRVVQQTASDPCNLRIHARPGDHSILVETDPIRDCSGNPVPDGMIVTFTAVDTNGRSTVDAVVKRGLARAELPAAPQSTISVASGVVMGNEIRWGGGK